MVPQTAAAAHALPFSIWDAFASERDGCARATIVAQYEHACDARLAVLRRAGLDDWARWRDENAAAGGSAAAWRRRVRAAFDKARREALGRADLRLTCAFAAARGSGGAGDAGVERVVDAAPLDDWARHQSTLVVECAVPPELRALACEAGGRVRVRVGDPSGGAGGAHPPVPVLLQRALPRNRTLGACLWVSGVGATASDRASPARVAGWLAHHLAAGVEHFAVYDNTPGVFAAARADRGGGRASSERTLAAAARRASPLWPALAPLAARGALWHAPWAGELEPYDGERPNATCAAVARAVARASRGAFSMQMLYGRPSQFAAQNSCHRRLGAAGVAWVLHTDVDELVLPAQPPLSPSSRESSSQPPPLVALVARKAAAAARRRENLVALALPCVFYGACPDDAAARGRADADDDAAAAASGDAPATRIARARCAGKMQPFRQKLIAHAARALLVWSHYVLLARGRTSAYRTGEGVRSLAPHVDARLAHVRADYSFANASAARAVDGASRVSRALEERFAATVLPRLDARGGSARSCEEAHRDALALPRGNNPAAAARPPPPPGGGAIHMAECPHTEDAEPWGWCWCRDTSIERDGWPAEAQRVLREVWGEISHSHEWDITGRAFNPREQ